MLSDFRNPPAAFRGKPLWAWNSRLDEQELTRQIEVFPAMGMGGFFMHSRIGLATEYLGREWFQAIRACVAKGKALGLESWLYDEDRWPSGSAGGLATADPAFRMRYLRCELDPPTARPPGFRVAMFAAIVDGIDLLSYRPLEKFSAKLHPGERRMVFSTELVRPHGFFNGATYLDTLNPAAVRRFLQITHERYRREVGEEFGKAIPGCFTDEPHRGFVMADTPEGWTYPPASRWVTPWTDAFAEEFRTRFGYDLRDRLPELFLRLDRRPISPVKWHYMECLHSLFLQSWAKPCREWCEEHGLQLTGHMLGEESPSAQAITCGSAMRYYEHLDVPGMDLLGRNNRAFWIARQVASVARQFGRDVTMSELYGCTGWQTTFADHKEIGDWQAFHGINLRCHHLAWYTMAGEAKRDFPASIFFQSPWYREYRAVEDYFARLHVVLKEGRAVCDLLVLHPVESIWAQVHAGWAGWIGSQSPGPSRIDRIFEKVFRWITADRFDFDYGDEEQLGRLGKVTGRGAAARLHLGRCSYAAVLISGMETMRSGTLRLLEEFRQKGGRVIFAGPPPRHVDASPSPAVERLSRTSLRAPLARAAIATALRSAIPPVAELENAGAVDITRPILLQTRKQGRAWTVALCNTDPRRTFQDLALVFRGGGGQVQEWDCRTGDRWEIPHRTRGGALRWTFSLPPLGEKVFRIVPRPDHGLPRRKVARAQRVEKISGPFAYSLDEPNACVLDRFQWRIARGPWKPGTDILEIDRLLRVRGGLPQRSLGTVQPWARQRAETQGVPISLRARFHAEEVFPADLMIEQPGRWTVSLNGRPVDMTRDGGWFIDPCFRRIPIPPEAMKAGGNVLTLSAVFDEDLDLEAVHLLGNFGVFSTKDHSWVLARLPARLQVGDVCSQGLPFYTGRIRYELPWGARPGRLRLPAFGGATAAVSFPGGQEPHILAFPPHEVDVPAAAAFLGCEIVLTRRNLFGPLHWSKGNKDFVAPDSFRTRGDGYSVAPLLEPSGLLQAPLRSA